MINIKERINLVKNILLIRNVIRFIERKPFTSFIATLVVLLLLIIVANILNRPQAEQKAQVNQKHVDTYQIGSAPRVNLQAKVEKAGVVTITAQSAGVVQQVYHWEGEELKAGTTLLGMSTNYQGGNIFSLQRQIAQKQYENTTNNYDLQKDLISKQREIANKSQENTEELRKISEQALNETRDQLAFNEDLLASIDALISSPAVATDAAQLRTLQQSKGQLLAAVNQLKSAVRSAEYQVDTDNSPTQLSTLQKDISLKQLDLQERGLDLGKEIALLNVRVAQINESLLYPSMPFSGTVERIYVRVGQAIAPGMPIALVSGTAQNNTAVIRVSEQFAKTISRYESSQLHIGNSTYDSVPSYISTEATDGQLYSVMYSIPNQYCDQLTDGSYISVSVPVGYPETGALVPFVPLDAVVQTQDGAYLYVVEDGKAASRKVTLGVVYGGFVEVTEGLRNGDQVILNRNVIAGETITTQ